MIVGDPKSFAIESEISSAYERPSLRALGFFVIHLDSASYGVRHAEATLLACSFDEIEKRLQLRGKHLAPFVAEPDAGAIADAIAQSVYASDDEIQQLLGLQRAELRNLLHANDIVWAPDGDQAFDDGSCVVQFDDAHRVRIIGFKYDEAYRHVPNTLKDVWIDAARFYELLDRWHTAFEAEWRAATKVP